MSELTNTPLPASQNLSSSAQSNLSTPEASYIFSLCRSGTDALAAISSDHSLRIIDKTTLQLLPAGVYKDIHPARTKNGDYGPTALCEYADGGAGLLVTSGRDGLVKVWDRRKGDGLAVVLKGDDKDKFPPLSAVACSPQTHTIAAGSELAMRAASINFWDLRFPSQKTLSYTESHNDDITVLEFSPFNPRLLLSGSTDTLVNIYDTSQPDEEDALKQVINHGSVHRAGFLSANAAYALSHDEHFAIHPLNAYARGEATTVEQGEKVAEEPGAVEFGDLRGQLRCYYVAQVVRGWGSGGVYVASGNTEQRRVDLMPVVREPKWRFDDAGVVRLDGAHGEEVVRDVLLDEGCRSVFTCGEDGFVRAWRVPGDEALGGSGNASVEVQKEDDDDDEEEEDEWSHEAKMKRKRLYKQQSKEWRMKKMRKKYGYKPY